MANMTRRLFGTRSTAAFRAIWALVAIVPLWSAACPSITPQAESGFGASGKRGFLPCPNECPQHYYLGYNEGDGWEATWTHLRYNILGELDLDNYEHGEGVSGTHIQIDPNRGADGNPRGYQGCSHDNCYSYYALNSYTKHVYRLYLEHGIAEGVCEQVDGGEPNPDGCLPGMIYFPELDLEPFSIGNCSEQDYGFRGYYFDENHAEPPWLDWYRWEMSVVSRTGWWYSGEHTTAQILGEAKSWAQANLQPFQTDNPVGGGTPVASTTLTSVEDCASAQISRWRAKVTGTEQGKRYDISYMKVEYIMSGGVESRSSTPVRATVTAPGDTWWFPSDGGDLLTASQVQGLCPSGPDGVHTISLKGFAIEPADDGAPPGSGGAGGSRGCGSCSTGADSGQHSYAGVSLQVSTGQALNGGSAGEFQLIAPFPSPALATPAALAFTGQNAPNNSVTVQLTTDGTLQAVTTPQALATITVTSPYAYQIAFTDLANSPIATWTIENPDASATVFNRLRITDQPASGSSRIWLYTYNTTTRVWTLALPGGLAEQRLSQVSDPVTQNRTETVQYAMPGGAVASEWTRVYSQYAWGEGLASETSGSGDSAQTTQYSYYTGAGDAGYSPTANQPPIRRIVRPDGTWEHYLSYDAFGRPLVVLSGIDTGPTDNPALCHSTEYSYAPVATGVDDGSIQPARPRKVVEKFKGTSVSLTYRVFQPGAEQELRCPNPTATYAQATSDPNTLVTTITYCTDDPNIGRVSSVDNPDGTMTFYAYDGGTTTISAGQPNANKSAIQEGTQSVTLRGGVGEVLSVDVNAITEGVPGALLSHDVYSDFDEFERSRQVTHLDNTSELTAYDCCGVDTTTDHNGMVSKMEYDSAHRLLGRTILSYAPPLSLTNILDPAGRVTATVRNGGGNWPIVQGQTAYDLAGRVTRQTNALGGVTIFSRSIDSSTGRRTVATTYPDGGARTEIYGPDGSVLSVTGSAAQPVRYEYGIDTGSGSPDLGRRYTKEIKLDLNGNDSSEWTKTYTDALGRVYKTVYAPRPGVDDSANPPCSHFFYNTKGQLTNQVDPDGVSILFAYNAKGEQSLKVLDMNQDHIIDYAGSDQITFTTNDVVSAHGTVVRQTRVYVWSTTASASNLVSTVETSVDGLNSWSTIYRDVDTPVVTERQTAYASSGGRSVTTIAPDNSYTISAYSYGRITSVTHYDSLGNPLSTINYGYDFHGRQHAVTDARNGTTTYTFNNADQVATSTTPAPGLGQAPQITTTSYDTSQRAWKVTQPDGTSVINEYYLTGLLKRTYGSRTYPVGYGYDYAGRMIKMTNWSGFPSTSPRVTTWNYNSCRGWLDSKRYPDGQGPDYTYTSGGRLKTRTWARTGTDENRIVTTYTYAFENEGGAGDLIEIAYTNDPQNTPGMSYTHDRMGRPHTVTRNGITATFTYNLAGEQLNESYSGGSLDGVSLSSTHDSFLRRTNLLAQYSSTPLLHHSFAYDSASRLQTVTDNTSSPSYSAAYAYLANSPLVSQIVFKQADATRMTTSNQWNHLNRRTSVSSALSAGSAVGSSYSYNTANQRVRSTLADGSYWLYEYDSLGQVKSGKKYWSDQTPVAGQQFEYAFDDIGNRTQAKTGGDETGANLRSASYSANTLNQYTSRTVPGAVDIMGVSFATNTVQVNNQTAYRKGEYFRKEEGAVSNGSAPVWQSITVTANGQTSVTGHEFVPKTPEQFYYDADGNLTNDGRWTYTWDAENRLVKMAPHTQVGPQISLRFEYDWQGRRIHKQVWSNATWNGTPTNDVKFVYDGWNLLAELNATNNAPIRSYVWGLDLSGSLQGAGGVGGLLFIGNCASSIGYSAPAFDGNGNVMALVSMTGGTNCATYEYGPFGELLRATGPLAKANPFRFSTKYQDDETDLLYYDYRYYNPSTGRWNSKDPLGEPGFELMVNRPHVQKKPVKMDAVTAFLQALGIKDRSSLPKTDSSPEVDQNTVNSYGFVGNAPITTVDGFGLFPNACLQPAPFLCTSSVCDSYGNEEYPGFGVSLKCFCKCAGDSKWSQQVRGCLACAHTYKVGLTEAHAVCYANATAMYGAPPVATLTKCFYQCGGHFLPPGWSPPPWAGF